jgi:hypothetical protein
MKLKSSAAIAIATVLALSGCSQGASTIEEAAPELEVEPYGGQCLLISDPLLQTSMAIIIPGSANFSDMDLLQEKVWEAGYESVGTWMTAVESLHPALMLLDTSTMTSGEAANIEYLQVALSSEEITKAVVLGDEEWFTQTFETVMAVGGACG